MRRSPIPYTYVVAFKRRRTRNRWSLSIYLPDGTMETLTRYTSQSQALSAARILAGSAGRVEVAA